MPVALLAVVHPGPHITFVTSFVLNHNFLISLLCKIARYNTGQTSTVNDANERCGKSVSLICMIFSAVNAQLAVCGHPSCVTFVRDLLTQG